jgi:hypothetical protein
VSGGRVRMQIARGWFGDRFYSGGWRAGRVLCADPSSGYGALVVVTRDGRVWRMVNPDCVRAA